MEKNFTPWPWFDVNYAGFIVLQTVEHYEQNYLKNDTHEQRAAFIAYLQTLLK